MDVLQYEEFWHYSELSERPLFLETGMPKPPWDEGKPTGELVRALFDISRLLPKGRPLPELQDEAQAYLAEKLKEAGTTISHLQQEAEARAQLHDESLTEIDYQISRAALSLDQFRGWSVGYRVGVDIKRNQLERDLSSLRKERRSTLLRTWEDIASLRKEFREAVGEYKSLLSRLGLL